MRQSCSNVVARCTAHAVQSRTGQVRVEQVRAEDTDAMPQILGSSIFYRIAIGSS